MSFFSKKETKFFIYGYYTLNFKKGILEKAETKTLKMSYILWRKKEISFLDCLNNILKNSSPYINFKKVKLKGVSAKIPFFLQNKKRLSPVFSWIYSNSRRKRFFSYLESFFLESVRKKHEFKTRKKIFHEVANQHKVFAFKRWF